ncbi:threonine/serine dehydratase [Streptomyces boluensis]|uniref:Pyridoxal-phosphate dependent enzyme n=1 Tax=Streptomyces boluensis TaxID=1775135 RepID=A0A964UTM0_9ACTN|nr:threonine/serine dehydratase [Streptomyces boluensis]NBE51435.1 pyridoxal-phosphate dependent enzyme [Streptomyces boluensis]
MTITYSDVLSAAARLSGRLRRVALSRAVRSEFPGADVWFAHEYLQYTGTFKARGALNFITSHLDAGTMPDAGVVIASGGNAGLACAWAAARHGVTATVFVPETAPPVKVAKLKRLGARVRQVGTEYAEALEESQRFAAEAGALESHAYGLPLIAAGAGTLLDEIHAQLPSVDTVLVAVGGGGLFTGVAAAAHEHGIRVVAVEPHGARALNAALEAGEPVDVPVDSVAADSLGARRVTPMALPWAQGDGVDSVLVDDADIVAARQLLWDDRRIVVEHGAAAGFAALTSGAYKPAEGETVAVILCGANTDPSDLVHA